MSALLTTPCSRCGAGRRLRRSVLCATCHAADERDLSPPRRYETACLEFAEASVEESELRAEHRSRVDAGCDPDTTWPFVLAAMDRTDAAFREVRAARRVR